MELVNCKQCGTPISQARRQRNSLYCSNECRNSVYASHQSEIDLSTGTVGAISELVVSTDLLLRGYEVFRAMSPSCSCDLLIHKKGTVLRVEVRTGYIGVNGKLHYGFNHRDEGRSDIVAAVVRQGQQIVYFTSGTQDEIAL